MSFTSSLPWPFFCPLYRYWTIKSELKSPRLFLTNSLFPAFPEVPVMLLYGLSSGSLPSEAFCNSPACSLLHGILFWWILVLFWSLWLLYIFWIMETTLWPHGIIYNLKWGPKAQTSYYLRANTLPPPCWNLLYNDDNRVIRDIIIMIIANIYWIQSTVLSTLHVFSQLILTEAWELSTNI